VNPLVIANLSIAAVRSADWDSWAQGKTRLKISKKSCRRLPEASFIVPTPVLEISIVIDQ